MYSIAYWLVTFYFWLFYGLRVYGREHIKPGAMIVAANHDAGADPIFAACAMSRKDRLRFMGKAELFRFPPLRWLLTSLGAYPIERGKGDIGALRKTLEMLKKDEKIIIFPDGHRSHDEDPENAKNGTALIACKSGAPVLPMYITPGRRFLKRNVKVIIGPSYTPALPEGMPRADGYRHITLELMNRIYTLKETQDAR